MANIVKTESGIDLLQRFSVRPKLIGLQVEVFGEDGPLPGDVIEINEKDTNLKTILLTQWIIKCILPATWKGVQIGGLEVGVVFLSTDHHFSSLNLVTLLERKLKRTLRQCQQLLPSSGLTMMKEITKDSLRRLSLYESFCKTELLFNFCSTKTFILSHSQSSVVILDSLSAYYWEDRLSASTIQSLEKYCQSLLQCLIEKLKQTNITIIYTVQQFLREVHERERSDAPLFIYSLSIENQPQSVIHVENRRTASKFSKKIESFKGDLLLK